MENLGALDVEADRADLARIDGIMPPGPASGTRYMEAGLQAVDR